MHRNYKNGTDPSLIPEMVTDYIYTNPVALKQLEEAKLASVFQDDLVYDELDTKCNW